MQNILSGVSIAGQDAASFQRQKAQNAAFFHIRSFASLFTADVNENIPNE